MSEHTPFDPSAQPSTREHVWRWVAGSMAATAAATLFSNMIPGFPGITVAEWDAKQPSVSTVTKPGGTHEIPGELRSETTDGLGLELEGLQRWARTFDAHPLDKKQTGQITAYVDTLQTMAENDPTITTITLNVTGKASDEDGSDRNDPLRNLGQTSTKNKKLAGGRGTLAADVARTHIAETGLSSLIKIASVDGAEVILPASQIDALSTVADGHKMTLSDMILQYNTGKAKYLTAAERQLMDDYSLKNNRGAVFASTITRETTPSHSVCDEVVQIVQNPPIVREKRDSGYPAGQFKILPIPLYWPRRKQKKPSEQTASATDEVLSEQEQQTVAAPITEGAKNAAVSDDTAKDTEANTTVTIVDGAAQSTVSQEPRVSILSSPSFTRDQIRTQRDQEYYQKYLDEARRTASHEKRKWVAAGALALLLIPLVRFENTTATNKLPAAEQCSTVDIQQGRRTTVDITTLGEYVAAALFTHHDPWHGFIDDRAPTTVTNTLLPHQKIIVDAEGNVIKNVEVPAQSNTTSIEPVFPAR